VSLIAATYLIGTLTLTLTLTLTRTLTLTLTQTLTPTLTLTLTHRQAQSASLAGVIEGYRFGNANNSTLKKVPGSEGDLLKKAGVWFGEGYNSWGGLDDRVWKLVWEWDGIHGGLQASRCCATVLINRSSRPLQVGRVQISQGRNVLMLGSNETGFEADSRVIMPGGSVVIFIYAFSPSPIESGHLKSNISTAAFDATVASNQRDSRVEAKGGFNVGFLEKSVSDWWSKYVILITSA
jgi:hypothetical protein